MEGEIGKKQKCVSTEDTLSYIYLIVTLLRVGVARQKIEPRPALADTCDGRKKKRFNAELYETKPREKSKVHDLTRQILSLLAGTGVSDRHLLLKMQYGGSQQSRVCAEHLRKTSASAQ